MPVFETPIPSDLESRIAAIEAQLPGLSGRIDEGAQNADAAVAQVATERASGDAAALTAVQAEETGRKAAVQQVNDLVGDLAVRVEQGDAINKQVLLRAELSATQAAARAGTAASAAVAAGMVYDTVAAGLAATAEGATFNVFATDSAYAITYRKVSGVAVPIKSLASQDTIDEIKAILSEALGEAALSVVDPDGNEGLYLSADFLRLVFGGADISGLASGEAATMATRDGNGAISVTALGLVLLATAMGAEFRVGDEDGYYLMRVVPGETALPGISATPVSADLAGMRIGRDDDDRPALVDDQGVDRLAMIPGGIRVDRMAVAYDDIPGVAFAFADPEGFFYTHFGDDGTGSSGGGNDAADLRPIFTDDLWLLPDRPVVLQTPMLFADRQVGNFARATVATGAWARSSHEEIAIHPADCAEAGELRIMRTDIADNGRIVQPFAIHVAEPAAQAPKILMIGDSISNRQLPALIDARLRGLGLNPHWIGTIASSADDDRWSEGGPLGEYREGRAFTDLVYSVLDGEAQILAPGQEATYLALPKTSKIAWNPLIRASTGGDDPAIVRNGAVLDFRQYLDRLDLPDPDLIPFLLGENDVLEHSDPAVVAARIIDAVGIIIRQARAALPNVRIAFGVSGQAGGAKGDVLWAARKPAAIRAIIQAVRDAADPLVSVIPSWAFMDPEAGWAIDATADPETGVLIGSITDNVHPIGTPRAQLAESYAAWIACNA